jgi:hypothetical protein
MANMQVIKEPPSSDFAMRWFRPFGVLMPAACPPEANQPEGALQVRAERVIRHILTTSASTGARSRAGRNIERPEMETT